MSISDNALGGTQTVTLGGIGVLQATFPTALSFGNVGVGTTNTKAITLHNNLPTPLTFAGATATGNFAVVKAASNPCGPSVPAGSYCSVGVSFTPSQLGPSSGVLTVNDGANNSPQTAILTGNGTDSSISSISVACASSSFSVGATDQCTATGTFPGGETQNLTALVGWSSSSTKVATISNLSGSQGLVTGKAAGTTTIKASLTVNGTTKSGSTSLTVTSGGLITPTITWPTPAPIVYGTPLSSTQLDATATAGGTSISGTFTYTPVVGTVLSAGSQTLSTTFTPTNTAQYNTATASVVLTVNKALASVTLSNLSQTYTGSPLTPTAITSPAGLAFSWTGAPDTNAGTYPVTATISNTNYTGSATGSFVINPAAATITLSNLSQTYTGSPLTPTAITSPAGLAFSWTGAPDTNAGTYPVTATISNTNYTGSATGSFVINPAAATITLSNLSQTYTGSPLTPTAITSPAGLAFTWTGAPDTNAGTYPVTATISNTNYTGSATGSFVINPAAATITLSNLSQTYTGSPLTPTVTTIPINLTYTLTGAPDTALGTYPVTATVTDPNYTGSTVGSFAITPSVLLVSIAITPSNSSTALGSSPVPLTATGTYSDSSTQSLTSAVTWVSSATNVATVSSAGLATATGVGTTIISATSGTVTGSTFLSVDGTGGITPGGTMISARDPFTATLLPSGKVLMAGGVGTGGAILSSAELSDLTGSSFTATGSMTNPRAYHTATLLNNGTVLLVGGTDGSNYLATAEIYDPSSGTFTATGSLQNARQSHTATLLQDGTVLIAGGYGPGGEVAVAELFNPTQGVFTSVGSLNVPRDTHIATLLNDGTVLIAGGYPKAALASVELYDPTQQAFFTPDHFWSCVAPCGLNTGRVLHTATLLDDGTVLFAGGQDNFGNVLSSAELYFQGVFTTINPLAAARYSHTATLLTNGKVLLAGGIASTRSATASLELYDPGSQTFSLATDVNSNIVTLITPRYSHTATKLTNASVLLAGGVDTTGNPAASTELYSPSTLAPASLSAITVSPGNLTTVAKGTSQHFTASDQNGSPLASVTWIASGAVTTISNDASNAGTVQFTAQGSESITACAGSICGSTTPFQIGSPALVSITVTAPGALNPTNPAIQVNGTQPFQAIGTFTDQTTMDLTNMATTTWASSSSAATISPTGLATGDLPGPASISATSTYNATPGYGVTPIAASERLTVLSTSAPPAGTWAFTGSMNVPRNAFAATLLNNGKVLMSGGISTFVPYPANSITSSAELYDPSSGFFTLTGSMNIPRQDPFAALLNNGKVLIVGGDADPSNSYQCGLPAELYDPQAGAFTLTGTAATIGCRQPAVTVLACPTSNPGCAYGGMVLVTGGAFSATYPSNPTNAAELYDPATGLFTPTGGMTAVRSAHSSTLLNDGTVLIAGGVDTNGTGLTSAEIYNPAAGTFTAVNPMATAHGLQTATLLNNSQVLIAGGGLDQNGTEAADSELYDPATQLFSVIPSGSPSPWYLGTATLLNNGTDLLEGGFYYDANTSSWTFGPADLYDSSTLSFSPTGNLNISREYQAATILADGTGRVLVAGGDSLYASPESSAELYYPVSFTPPGLVSIAVLPGPTTVAVGSSVRFIAQDQNGAQLASITWSSSNSTLVEISNDLSNPGVAFAVAPGTVTITACAGTICSAPATLTSQ